jgi:hypothetical protein
MKAHTEDLQRIQEKFDRYVAGGMLGLFEP